MGFGASSGFGGTNIVAESLSDVNLVFTLEGGLWYNYSMVL